MVNYSIVKAIDWLSEFQKEHGCSDYVVIKADDGKEYQVKFDVANSKEFIAHYVASLIGVPVPSGKIILIEDYLFESIKEQNSRVSEMKSKHYFAVEWYGNTVKWQSYQEFIDELKNIENFHEFVSIFPFDQYLRNYDRNEQNHIIIKEKSKRKFYNSIDADRTFGGYPFENILLDIDEYSCAYPATCGKILYSLIDDSSFSNIIKYANAVSIITATEIEDILNICNFLYDLPKELKSNIVFFLNKRKDLVYDACMKNTKCYTNVTRSLYAD